MRTNSTAAQFATVVLTTVVGCFLTWVALRVTSIQWRSAIVIAAAAVVAFIFVKTPALTACLNAVRFPTYRGKAFAIAVISASVSLIMLTEKAARGDSFSPYFHDEHSYLIQAQMLAKGKLWLPPHPVADAFESMHLLQRPVYSSIYFPGTALVHVPGIWLGLPHWVIPVLIASASCALLYLVLLELVDGVAGILGAALLCGLPAFRGVGFMAISQPLMLLLALLLLFLWIWWRRRPSIATAAAIGLVGGLALITRPIEAMAYALPVGIAMLPRIWGMPRARGIAHLALLFACPLPFLGLQACHNYGTTGNWRRFASDDFVARNYPAPMIGRGPLNPNFEPGAINDSIRASVRDWVIPHYLLHRGDPASDWFWNRWPTFAFGIAPNGILLAFAAVGSAGLGRKQRWVLFAPIPLTLAFYYHYVFYIAHYSLVMFPGFVVGVVLVPHVLSRLWPRLHWRFHRSSAVACITAAVLGLSPFASSRAFYNFEELAAANRAIGTIQDAKALVIVSFHAGANSHQEPVYNWTTAEIDDSRVVRAHDLGPQENLKLFRYYAAVQPGRYVYRYDRRTRVLTPLGSVVDLARAPRMSTTFPADR